jgi:hypothetical protein
MCVHCSGGFVSLRTSVIEQGAKYFLTEEAKTPKRHAADCGFQRFHSLRSEVAMSIFSYRKHLRFLSQAQRRRWWDQKKRLTPRIVIGAAYVPPNVTREFAYIKVG